MHTPSVILHVNSSIWRPWWASVEVFGGTTDDCKINISHVVIILLSISVHYRNHGCYWNEEANFINRLEWRIHQLLNEPSKVSKAITDFLGRCVIRYYLFLGMYEYISILISLGESFQLLGEWIMLAMQYLKLRVTVYQFREPGIKTKNLGWSGLFLQPWFGVSLTFNLRIGLKQLWTSLSYFFSYTCTEVPFSAWWLCGFMWCYTAVETVSTKG